jgi:hypothetical protein
LTEGKKGPQAFEVLLGRQGAIRPRGAKLSQGVDVQLLEQPESLVLAPEEQAVLEEVLLLAQGRGLALARRGVIEKLRDGVG